MRQKHLMVVILAALLTISLGFIGCDISSYDTYSALESKKVTTNAPPTIYTGAEGDVVLLPETDQVEILWDESEYTFLADTNGDGVVDATEIVSEADATHQQIGVRLVGYYTQDLSLWAGQDLYAGTVSLVNDATGITLRIDTTDAADIAEYHINVYTDLSQIPTSRPAPGQSDYVVENVNSDSIEVYFTFEELGGTVNSTYYFIIHTALGTDGEGSTSSLAGETAYVAGDNPSFGGKGAWFYVVGYTALPFYEPIIVALETEEPPTNPPTDTTGWSHETAYVGNARGDGNAWWFYIDASAPDFDESTIFNIYAGQHQVLGAYATYAKSSGTLTIVLGENMVLVEGSEVVKIKGYDVLPTVRPPSGQFPVKLSNTDSLTDIDVLGSFDYLLVHLDSLVQ